MNTQDHSTLSFLCVTRGEDCVLPLIETQMKDAEFTNAEYTLVCDGQEAYDRLKRKKTLRSAFVKLHLLKSNGYIESILDAACKLTTGSYILRLDDDETLSPTALWWIKERSYLSHPHWKFRRAHLWRDENHYLTNLPLWEDHQTRLSTRDMSIGRSSIHCGSPFGGGELAPSGVYLCHHKFLVKSFGERKLIVNRYETIQSGAGNNFLAFSLPESAIGLDNLNIKPISELD